MPRFGHSLPKEKLGGIGLPSWLPDWLTGKDVKEIQGPVYIPPRGTKGGYRKEMAWDVARGYTDPFTQRNVASGVMAAADLIPVVGDVTGIEETKEDWKKGDYIPAIAGGLGTAIAVVPGLEGAGKLIKEGGKKLAKGLGEAAEHLPNVEKTASAVVDPVAPKGLGGPSKELDEIIASGEAAAFRPKIEPVQTVMARKASYDVMGKDDWVRFNKAHKTGEGVTDAELPIHSLNAPHEVNPDFAAAAARYGGRDEARPLIIKKGGQYYVADGVHRLAAAEKAGQQTANVRLVDLDQVNPVVPQGLGAPAKWGKHPISKIKTTVPVEAMHAEYEPFGTMVPEKQIGWEDLEGHNIVPLLGDPTIAGQRLLGLGGKRFEQGVDLYGGPNFPRIGGNWANTAGAASKMGKDIAGLGGPTSGVYMKMSEHSGDYAAHMAQTVHQQFKQARAGIDNKAIKAFDDAMRADWIKKKKGGFEFPATRDWPGMENLTDEWIMSHPNDRKKMVKMMNQKPYQDAGFPDVGYARWATTEPDLLNAETYSSGHSAIQFDPEGKVLRNTGRHPTYPDEPVGTYSGRLPEVPLRVLHKEYLESGGTRGAPIPNQYLYKFLQTRPPIIKLTGERLDRVMNYLRSKEGGKLGLAGAVTAGIISQQEADEINQGAAG